LKGGCCLGALVLLLLAIGALGGAGWFIWNLGLFEELPEHDVAQRMRSRPSVMLVLDPDDPGIRPWVREQLNRFTGVLGPVLADSLPRQAVFALTPERQTGSVRGELLLSTARLTGLFESRLMDSETWRWTPGQKVTRVGFDEPGLWRVDSEYGLHPEAALEASRRWAKPGAPLEPAPPRHAAQLLIDNRDGAGFLALSPLLNPPPQPGDLFAHYDAADHADWLACIDSADARFDADADGTARLAVDIECPGPDEARRLLYFLEQRKDEVEHWIGKWGGRLEGQWQQQGAALSASFSAADAPRLLNNYLTWKPAS